MSTQEEGQQGGKKPIEINITQKDGDLSYDPCCPKVKRGDLIHWICERENGDYFAVHIGWNTPLDEGRYRKPCGAKIVAQVDDDAQYGEYKYSVSVFDGSDIWTDDPIFIVRRR